MKLLEQRIQEEAVVKAGGVLKVDSFINHQMDVQLFQQLALEWREAFADSPINKILTVESSGIGLATVAGLIFEVPVVFAKKSKSINLDGTVYCTEVKSGNTCTTVIVSKRYIGPEDHVLIVDDILANGNSLNGLAQICEHAGAVVEGVGVAIEKGYMPGGKLLRERGYRVEPLALVTGVDPETGEVRFG